MTTPYRVPDLAYILPLGYSPALEPKYIAPCKNSCECSTLKSARRSLKSGHEIPDNLIESRVYLYDFSFFPRNKPYRGKDGKQYGVGYGYKPDVSYKVCTGCQKPANTYEANKINKVLGFTEPKRVIIPLDLGVVDLL